MYFHSHCALLPFFEMLRWIIPLFLGWSTGRAGGHPPVLPRACLRLLAQDSPRILIDCFEVAAFSTFRFNVLSFRLFQFEGCERCLEGFVAVRCIRFFRSGRAVRQKSKKKRQCIMDRMARVRTCVSSGRRSPVRRGSHQCPQWFESLATEKLLEDRLSILRSE